MFQSDKPEMLLKIKSAHVPVDITCKQLKFGLLIKVHMFVHV